MFHYFNPNPCGLRTGDCLYRALSYFLGMTWRATLDGVVAFGADRGRVDFNSRSLLTAFLKERGYVRHGRKEFCGKDSKGKLKKMTVAEFRDNVALPGKAYLVSCTRHLTVIHDKEIIDSWDCSGREADGFWER